MNSKIIVYAGAVGLVIVASWMYVNTPVVRLVGVPTVSKDIALPINWGDYSAQMQKLGVIDPQKMNVTVNGPRIIMTKENSHELLNLFWAFGLANKNPILKEGPMMDPRYGGAQGFASTGGWSLAAGDPMSHYNTHEMVTLTPDQQALVERVSKNIYRPCCDNSTYFPDCNHGMAMLGLLELMAAQNVSEQEMYGVALAVNRFWFSSQYEVIDQYLAKEKIIASPKEILSARYSSASGYRNVISTLKPKTQGGGSSCSA